MGAEPVISASNAMESNAVNVEVTMVDASKRACEEA